MAHNLHVKVAEVIQEILGEPGDFKVELDAACLKKKTKTVKKHLPFFLLRDTNNASEITNVDLMIVKGDKVKLVCEVEESDISPIRTFGKFFSAATSVVYKFKNGNPKELGKNGIFIQILSSKKLKKEKSSKENQGVNIEKTIRGILKSGDFWIKEYHLIYGDEACFKPGGKGYLEIEKIVKTL